jgi:hypothetical protein
MNKELNTMRKTMKLSFCVAITVILAIGCVSCKKSDNHPPSEVTNLKISNGTTGVSLTWNDPTDEDLAKVEISYTINSEYLNLEVFKGIQSAAINNLVSGSEYSFTVRTIDNNGNKSIGIMIAGNPDYRNDYTGDYRFNNFYHFREAGSSGDSTSNSVIDYNGTIEKYQTDQLKIIFAPDYIEPYILQTLWPLHNAVYGLIYPTIDHSSEILSYPNLHYSFNGSFAGKDSINFYIAETTHWGEESYTVFGKRINIK